MKPETCIFRITAFFVLTGIVLLAFSSLLSIIAKHPQIVLLFVVVCGIFLVSFLWWRTAKGRSTTHGSAQFAPLQEIRQAGMLFPRFMKSREQWFLLGRFKGRTIGLRERVQQAHVLMLAPTRAGKSTTMIIPNLLRESGKRSVFVNDLKGELAALCAGTLAQTMPVYLFAPTKKESAGYNPLAYVDGLEDAQDVAECIVKNTGGTSNEPFWDNAVKVLLTATILHIKATSPNAPFSALVETLSENMAQVQETISNSPSLLARNVAGAFLEGVSHNERLSGSIMTDVQARLLSLKIPALQRVTSRNTIDLEAAEPIALFIQIPPDESVRLKWLSSCLTMQLMKRIVRRASPRQQWAFYLDELANMGHIPHYLQYISYVGGLGVSLIQAAQDFGQLERIYGEDGRSTILANSATQLVFPGCGLKEATYYSDTIGYTTTYSASSSWQDGKFFTTQTKSRAEAQRKLIHPDELRTLPDGQIIVCSKNRRPFRLKSTPYYRDRLLLARTRTPAPQLAGAPPVLALPAPTTRPHPGLTSAQAEPHAPVVTPKIDAPPQEQPPFVKPDSWL